MMLAVASSDGERRARNQQQQQQQQRARNAHIAEMTNRYMINVCT